MCPKNAMEKQQFNEFLNYYRKTKNKALTFPGGGDIMQTR